MNYLLWALEQDTLAQEAARRASWLLIQRMMATVDIPKYVGTAPKDRNEEFAGTITQEGRASNYARLTDATLAKVYQGRVKADTRAILGEYVGAVATHACECHKGLKRRNYSRKLCSKCGELPTRASEQFEKFAELANKNRITCPALFGHGENEQDGFSRAIALRYLTKRMVYTTGRGKGKQFVKTWQEGRASSSQHSANWANAANVEDVCQDAFVIFWTQKAEGKLHGETFRDTTRACRTALTNHLRVIQKQRKTIDGAAYRALRDDDKQRSKANRTFVAMLDDTLVNAVAQEGSARQEDIARHFNVSQQAISKRLAKQREEMFV